MALLPMGLPTTGIDRRTDHSGYYAGETQETMFDQPTALAAHETYEATYDAPVETSYEPMEEFAEDVPELISYQAGNGQPGTARSGTSLSGTEHPGIEPETGSEVDTAAHTTEAAPEPSLDQSTPVQPEQAFAPPAMLTANDFEALEDRVLRAVALVRSERQARLAAERRMVEMEVQLQEFEGQIQQLEAQSPILDRLVQEVESLRIEREQVRQRVERLLGQLDTLEL